MEYPKIEHYGTRNVRGIETEPDTVIQEKVDGSQISFGVFDNVLHIRSKTRDLDLANPDKMFAAAVESIQGRLKRIVPGYWYRGEYLSRPKHNVIAYSRVPRGHVVLFDIQDPAGAFFPASLARMAAEVDLEYVPAFGVPVGASMLGSVLEGHVYKNYRLGLFAKRVLEQFRELRTGRPRVQTEDPNRAIGLHYATPARWEKAVHHLRDAGMLQGTPRDIGPLIMEIRRDIELEHHADILEALYKAHSKKILEATHDGFPAWYQDRLSKGDL